jgi:uncharacterized protein (TIGR03083 family)
MATDLDYLAHLATESGRFAAAVRRAAPAAPVPSCPDWNADDLLWHLAVVQWFWGTVVRERISGTEAQDLKPQRPADRAGLSEFYERASKDLREILAANPPRTPAWTWSPADQTVGFIRRRQAHEALIHRIDAELTAGDRTPANAQLSADGVDEVLRVMYGGAPPWGTFTPDQGKTLRVHASDTGDTWFVTLGRFTGTDPEGGTEHSEPDIRVAATDPATPPAAEISGEAADLDCWLWRRPTVGPVERSGDQAVLDSFESIIAPGID